MSTSLFFNLSFDLGGISLILFVVWFFVNFNNSEAAFKWFSLSILALLASVIILSYGSAKLSRMRSSLPSQNETEIMGLKQEISTLKSKKRSHTTTHQVKKKHSPSENKIKLPNRIVSNQGNHLVKEAVTKHPRHVYLIAKVTNPSTPVMVRGVHSTQSYKIKGHHNTFKTNEFVIIKGTATSTDNGVINLIATSGKQQPNSPKPM